MIGLELKMKVLLNKKDTPVVKQFLFNNLCDVIVISRVQLLGPLPFRSIDLSWPCARIRIKIDKFKLSHGNDKDCAPVSSPCLELVQKQKTGR